MIIAIRIRGLVGLKKPVKDTFQMLRLKKSNHCVVLPENPIYEGMVKKVKDYVMYGPISDEVLKQLLEKRLMTNEGKKADSKLVDKTIKTLKSGKLLKDTSEVKPYLRLSPPKGGFKGGIKKTVKQGGVIGFHESMDESAKKMM